MGGCTSKKFLPQESNQALHPKKQKNDRQKKRTESNLPSLSNKDEIQNQIRIDDAQQQQQQQQQSIDMENSARKAFEASEATGTATSRPPIVLVAAQTFQSATESKKTASASTIVFDSVDASIVTNDANRSKGLTVTIKDIDLNVGDSNDDANKYIYNQLQMPTELPAVKDQKEIGSESLTTSNRRHRRHFSTISDMDQPVHGSLLALNHHSLSASLAKKESIVFLAPPGCSIANGPAALLLEPGCTGTPIQELKKEAKLDIKKRTYEYDSIYDDSMHLDDNDRNYSNVGRGIIFGSQSVTYNRPAMSAPEYIG